MSSPNTTTWSPDSCSPVYGEKCIVEIDENFQFVSFIQKCPRHQNIPDNTQGFSQLVEEHRRGPEKTFVEVLDAAPTSFYDIVDGERRFKRGIDVAWNWSNGTDPTNSVLNVTVSGFSPTANQKVAVQNKVDNKFGAGKVIVNWV